MPAGWAGMRTAQAATTLSQGEAMVGRTRLIRKTGSPLIGGFTRPKKPVWPWLLAAAGVAAATGLLWYVFLR
jgi:hypothetical protein